MLESANDRSLLGPETQGNPPPSPPGEAAFPAFTASAPKAVHPTSVLSGSAAEGNEGAFQAPVLRQDSLSCSPHEAPSIPIGACANGVTEGTSVPFVCGNVTNTTSRGSHLPALRAL